MQDRMAYGTYRVHEMHKNQEKRRQFHVYELMNQLNWCHGYSF